ncbi:phospholipid hydroperoxide glutathione peroxidase GPX4-like [Centruroides vittatus]|uniref:phospholipid hydroperoxide glutathione peroxidase GPX4-like n=1 Tax=Centruroides vittatus TaxID=120091 RepID=UPI00350F515E
MAAEDDWKNAKSIYEFSAVDINGNEVLLEKYRGRVVLVVNSASNCAFTPANYIQLQALYEKYNRTHGLQILCFPCNQFANQEPENESYIKEFIKKYNIQFDMFSKINVNGDDAHPLWKYLKFKQGINSIKWNFTKFLVDKNGQPVARYPPNYQPLDIEPDILKYIEKSNL